MLESVKVGPVNVNFNFSDSVIQTPISLHLSRLIHHTLLA